MASFVSAGCSGRPGQNLETEQVADTVFVPTVASPAYVSDHPTILFDEGHNNYHTLDGGYRPFAELLRKDGYELVPNRRAFSRANLDPFSLLVIVNASGGSDRSDPDSLLARPAFADEEIRAIRAWVAEGGALLLVADHAPSGAAASALAAAFGVEMRNSWTFDPEHGEPGYGRYNLVFSRENGLLRDHPISTGRNASERLSRVVSFTGQSLRGPAESLPLLSLSDAAVDEDETETVYETAAGRSQGLALSFGDGRVVVLGEAAMLTAQQRVRDGVIRRYGISYGESDNLQFVLNIMHWLSGLLDPPP